MQKVLKNRVWAQPGKLSGFSGFHLQLPSAPSGLASQLSQDGQRNNGAQQFFLLGGKEEPAELSLEASVTGA